MPDLFVTDYTPSLGSGRQLRVYALVLALSELGPVDVLYVRFGADEPPRRMQEDPNIRLHPVDSSRGLRRAVTFARSRLAGTPTGLAKAASPEMVARARELAPAPGQGRVIADGQGVRMALRGLERSHGVVYNGHNLESGFQEQLGDEAVASTDKLAKLEAKIFRRSTEAWMVSHRDVEGARRLAPGARIRYVPNVVDVAAITPVRPLPTGKVALFAADHTWPPNQQATRLLLDEVMPQVWEQHPDARLVLTGKGLELDGSLDPRVEPLGFVEDIGEQYRRASCVLVPLLTGGGSPLKFVEGLAHGLPVVATPHAARGLDLDAGRHYIEGEGADGLARGIAQVLSDGAPGIADAARQVAQERYSVQALVPLIAPGAVT